MAKGSLQGADNEIVNDVNIAYLFLLYVIKYYKYKKNIK